MADRCQLDGNFPAGFEVEQNATPSPTGGATTTSVLNGTGGAFPEGFEVEPDAHNSESNVPQSGSFPPGFEPEQPGKFETPGQKALTAAEGVVHGYLGPVATWGENKLAKSMPGLSKEERAARAAVNPWLSGGAEAAGFGLGALTGTGEAAVLGKVGEAAEAMAGLKGAVTVADKLKAAAIASAAEMGAFQAGDEISNKLNNAPQSVGSVVSDVGLASLMGGVAGPVFGGAGMVAKSVLDNSVMKDFVDRLAYRKANLDPNDMIKHEADNVINTYYNMNDAITGANGMKSQAIQKLLPEEITKPITNQITDIMAKSQQTLADLAEQKVPERYIAKLQNDISQLQEVLSAPSATVGDRFDALNDFKKTLQDYSKGNWGPFAVPSYHEAYDFLNATKSLSREVRMGLEDSKVWGKAADLQKQLNKSWQKALPAAEDFEKKFMTKIGNDRVISSDKFNTYMNQSGRATSTTDRQKMMGNFIDAMHSHFNTVNDIYKSAGVENPFGAVGMTALKESLEKKSIGAKLADTWHDRLGASSVGSSLGALVGGHIGGLGGVYLGKEVLGPVFANMIKPVLEKYPNIDVNAFHQALAYGKSVMKGEKLYANAMKSIFEGGVKTFPSHVLPSNEDLNKLDERAKKLNNDIAADSKLSGTLGYNQPEHGMAVNKTLGDAIQAINDARPEPVKKLPLDTPMQPSQASLAAFKKTLTIAQQPMSVLKLIKDNTITPQDIQTLKTIYPDYYVKMSKDILQQVAEYNAAGETMPYAMKQSLSMFLGEPLDSSMTPSSILAAQPMPKTPPQPQGAKMGKKGTSTLGKSNSSYRTPNQTAEADRSSRD